MASEMAQILLFGDFTGKRTDFLAGGKYSRGRVECCRSSTSKVAQTCQYKRPNILKDAWYQSLVNIHKDAVTTPWLRSFLNDMTSVIREETKSSDPKLMESLGGHNFTSLEEIVDMYRERPEEYGLVQCIMAFIMRAVPMLRYVHPRVATRQNAQVLTCVSEIKRLLRDDPGCLREETWPVAMGISGGLIAASTMAISNDFQSLYDACVVAMGSVCRLCNFAVSWIRCACKLYAAVIKIILGYSTNNALASLSGSDREQSSQLSVSGAGR